MKRKAVRYVAFPDTEGGKLGFYNEPTDNSCVEPRYAYKHSDKSCGYCHINNPGEMDVLANHIGAMTRDEFMALRQSNGYNAWLNAYSEYLSTELGKALQMNGIVLKIRDTEVLFYCKYQN